MARRTSLLDTLLDALFGQIFNADWKGRHGEQLAARQLKQLSRFMGEGKVLCNAYVPKSDGTTSEIDVLFITSRGVFVIESKNYSGWIFGNEADRNWTACLQSGQKNRFYNPIRQNRTHIRWLGRYLGDSVPLYSLIVFSERCELKKITVASDDVAVIKRNELGRTVRRIWEGAAGTAPVDVGGVYRRLEPLTHADAQTRSAHVTQAQAAERGTHRAAHGTGGAAGAGRAAQAGPLCPRCGKPLVVRTAKRGANAGSRFYGCSGYPACRYTRSL